MDKFLSLILWSLEVSKIFLDCSLFYMNRSFTQWPEASVRLRMGLLLDQTVDLYTSYQLLKSQPNLSHTLPAEHTDTPLKKNAEKKCTFVSATLKRNTTLPLTSSVHSRMSFPHKLVWKSLWESSQLLNVFVASVRPNRPVCSDPYWCLSNPR